YMPSHAHTASAGTPRLYPARSPQTTEHNLYPSRYSPSPPCTCQMERQPSPSSSSPPYLLTPLSCTTPFFSFLLLFIRCSLYILLCSPCCLSSPIQAMFGFSLYTPFLLTLNTYSNFLNLV